MLNPATMKTLAARKQRLVAESELTRETLRGEFLALRAAGEGVAESVKSAQTVLGVALLAAPVAGLLLGGKKGGWKGMARAGLAAWGLFQRLKGLWGRF